ncbi:MAG TPA: hypothetical protein VHU17_00225, partial [Acidimicrobiales bacterium]|nr:hypothetical protein [Acidimicrobiales bacterium]
LSGPALVHGLIKLHPDMKVLFMSGYTEGQLKDSFVNEDSPLLSKPFAASALLEVADAIIGGSSPSAVRALLSRASIGKGPAGLVDP